MNQPDRRTALLYLCSLLSILPACSASRLWDPQYGVTTLLTPWGSNVSADPIGSVTSMGYPRPQMVRYLANSSEPNFINLNGLWEFELHAPGAKIPFGRTLKRSILIPFPPESYLSGLQTMPNYHMWYRRLLEIPENFTTSTSQILLLNFGAVDWEARVFVDGNYVCSHKGGYSRFACNISPALSADPAASHEVLLAVYDPTEFGRDNLFGKQRSDYQQLQSSGGILYEASSGIWQTVWLEAVEPAHIKRLDITSTLTALTVTAHASWEAANLTAVVLVTDPQLSTTVGSTFGAVGTAITLNISVPHLWSTSDPFLYDIQVSLKDITAHAPLSTRQSVPALLESPLSVSAALSAPAVDTVSSYAGMRTVSRCLDGRGLTRFCLNGQPTLLNGLLDQGLWPDGLYTAPSEDALAFDIELAKQAGFNMLRKHVKVEPDVWFAMTDQMGILVLQDIPSPAGSYYDLAGPTMPCCYPVAWNSSGGYNNVVTQGMRASYLHEVRGILEQHMSSPSLIAYILFNEGWGQPLDTAAVTREVMAMDGTRLHNSASGWNNSDPYLAGDFLDIHDYSPFGPTATAVGGTNLSQFINIVGEWGSVGMIVPERPIYSKNVYIPNYATMSFEFGTWLQNYERMLATIGPQLTDSRHALSGLVYTELTDAAFDITGLCTFDRIVIKINLPVVAQLNARLYDLFAA